MSQLIRRWEHLLPKSPLMDILLAGLLAYFAALLFGIAKDWPTVPFAKVTFFFAFSIVSPFLAPMREPFTALSTMALVAAYFSALRWLPSPWRLIALTIVSIAWVLYGTFCIVVFSGGA